MNFELYKKLYEEELISAASLEKVKVKHEHPLFSVHWELKTLLYLGVMTLSTGLGVIIYKNIDTIGHQVIIMLIAALSGGCFAYCIKKKKPFSREKLQSPGSFFDYILLLGCLSFVTFLGYLQFVYQVFGERYGMATLIPMLVLFYVAYEFDHLGVLGLAIANLALWMGVSITPGTILGADNFNSMATIYTYFLFSILLLAAAFSAEFFNFKKHFKFSYQHFGVHIGYIALLAGYFLNQDSPNSMFWLLGIFILGAGLYLDSLRNKSFYFLLLIMLYSYIAVSALVLRGLSSMHSDQSVILGLMYFILSATSLTLILGRLNKKIKGL